MITNPFRVQQLGAEEIPLMESLSTVFGEAFGEVDNYFVSRPSRAFLQRLLNSDHFIALVAVADSSVVELKRIAAARGAYAIFVQADVGDAPAINLYTKLGTR